MLPHEVEAHIASGLRDCEVHVSEFSGGTDHYAVVVVTPEFDGLPLLKRHRRVMDLFRDELGTEEVHALTIKAFTPAQWETERPRFEALQRAKG